MARIHYFAHVGFGIRAVHSAPSAERKVAYIAHCLKDMGITPIIVSPASVQGRRFQGPSRGRHPSGICYRHLSGWPNHRKWTRRVARLWMGWVSLAYLTISVDRTDTVIVYHSPVTSVAVLLSHKLRRYNLILEVEEVYGSIENLSPPKKLAEKAVLREANGYILSTGQMKAVLGPNPRPSIIVHGEYRSGAQLANETPARANRKLNLLYAGTLDPRKGGRR